MDLNSPFFDRIRIRPSCDEPREAGGAGLRQDRLRGGRASTARPKGRGREGQYWRFCLEHVREYNASYNYFAGMSDDAVAAYQKDAVIGHRPTFPIGRQRRGERRRGRAGAAARLGLYRSARRPARRRASQQARRAPAEAPKRRYSGVVQRALDTLGLDESADATAIKAQYKSLVKRFHPDAHGGDRSFEDRLRDIIRAHDTLKAAGLC